MSDDLFQRWKRDPDEGNLIPDFESRVMARVQSSDERHSIVAPAAEGLRDEALSTPGRDIHAPAGARLRGSGVDPDSWRKRRLLKTWPDSEPVTQPRFLHLDGLA